MSFTRARLLLGDFAMEVDTLNKRLVELENEIVRKTETVARLEQRHKAPVSLTASIVGLRFGGGNLGSFKLKPTQTRVANEYAFPEIEAESREASEIKPWLFLAGNIVARDADLIKSKGITRILNAAHTVCPNYFEHDKSFKYLSFDLIDHPSETIDHFILNAIAEIESAREDGTKILVHCHQGVSRSATIVVAYIAWLENLPVMDALMYVKARRKIVSPNTGFIHQLQQFEKRLRLEPSATVQPSLHHVTQHSESIPTLVVKQVSDANRPLIDEDDVFLIHEGAGGDILIREPKIKTDPKLMETAVQVAGWMSKYEHAFINAKVIVVQNEDERFMAALNKLPKKQGAESAPKEEYVVSTSTSTITHCE